MSGEWYVRLIDTVAGTLGRHCDELDALDEALGDGDHGRNMLAGIEAVQGEAAGIEALPLEAAMRRTALLFREHAGGAGGRYMASVVDAMASAAPQGRPGARELARMLEAGVERLRADGDVDVGMKTMFDVLQPLSDRLSRAIGQGHENGLDDLAISVCGHALHRTSYMVPMRGKAAAMGDAGKGHIDPGACSVALIVGALVGELTRERQD
ncbi:MAG: DAK2 domain-containing protein [Geminicoccaceae bacterium]|nr:DAK2 domain-containing protein [Geminicoccaceae bacterium]MCB9942393.1 DAK2 domain-containing protein [Geminicoccaceae bacterium]